MKPQCDTTRDLVTVGHGPSAGAKGGAAGGEAGHALDHAAPPELVEAGEVELGPSSRQLGRRAALVAGEGAALAHDRVEADRQAQRAGDDRRRLQRPAVGAGDHAGAAAPGAGARAAAAACSTPARSAAGRASRHRSGWRRNARSRRIPRGESTASCRQAAGSGGSRSAALPVFWPTARRRRGCAL